MRDSLTLFEIEIVLQQYEVDVEAIMDDMKAEAKTCICAAHSQNECMCGAWDRDEE